MVSISINFRKALIKKYEVVGQMVVLERGIPEMVTASNLWLANIQREDV